MLRMHMLALAHRQRSVVLRLPPQWIDLCILEQQMVDASSIVVPTAGENIHTRVMRTIGCLPHHLIKKMTQGQICQLSCVVRLLHL
jgi:hypothetical protein